MWGFPRWKELGRVEVGRGRWCEVSMVGGDYVLLRHQAQLKGWILASGGYQKELRR